MKVDRPSGLLQIAVGYNAALFEQIPECIHPGCVFSVSYIHDIFELRQSLRAESSRRTVIQLREYVTKGVIEIGVFAPPLTRAW